MTMSSNTRFAASEAKLSLPRPLRAHVNDAQKAEGFPNSYSPEAFKIAERIIKAAANYDRIDLLQACSIKTKIEDAGNWYKS